MFILSADYAATVPRVDADQPRYSTYLFSEEEWALIHKIHDVLKVCFLLIYKNCGFIGFPSGIWAGTQAILIRD